MIPLLQNNTIPIIISSCFTIFGYIIYNNYDNDKDILQQVQEITSDFGFNIAWKIAEFKTIIDDYSNKVIPSIHSLTNNSFRYEIEIINNGKTSEQISENE